MTDPLIYFSAVVQSKQVGAGSRLFLFVTVLLESKLGKDCNTCSHCLNENDVMVGDCDKVKSGLQLVDGVFVRNDVFIEPIFTFTNDIFSLIRQKLKKFLTITVPDVASIGGWGGQAGGQQVRRTGHGRCTRRCDSVRFCQCESGRQRCKNHRLDWSGT